MGTSNAQKLSLGALASLVVGGMVGAGIFSIPRTFASATGPMGEILAWSIAGRLQAARFPLDDSTPLINGFREPFQGETVDAEAGSN